MNLLNNAWLPFRLKNGEEKNLPIDQITDPDIIDLALPRADFQGAAYQFIIGILQTVFAPKNAKVWRQHYSTPPSSDELSIVFKNIEHAFNLIGDGPLFMQDFDLLSEQKETSISGLLITAPGENGIKNNTDFFVKRGAADVMSLEMAAMALFTLQINAPSGGVGYRVGLRGGGPLSTLVMPTNPDVPLWQKLWLNVQHREFWKYDEPNLHDGSVFPWLAETKDSTQKATEIYQDHVHPLHMLWAMPRRIRLCIKKEKNICAISGKETPNSVTSMHAKNYGNNYAGNWIHPFTPYTWNPKKTDEEHLSLKGQPGGITYKTWDILTISSTKNGQRTANSISHYNNISKFSKLNETPQIWAFGYDMDNMKPRGWYSIHLPIFQLDKDEREDALIEIKSLQDIISNTLWHTRTQIKSAMFENPKDIKGDVSFIDLAFWHRTESNFYQAITDLTDSIQQGDSQLSPEAAKRWRDELRHHAISLFDEYALLDIGTERKIKNKMKARQLLIAWLYGGKDLKKFSQNHHISDDKTTGEK